MKLLTKIHTNYLKSTLIFLILGIIGFYIFIYFFYYSEFNDSLFSIADKIESTIRNGQTVSSIPPIIEISKVDNLKNSATMQDTMIFIHDQGEKVEFTELSLYKKIRNINYHIIIRSENVTKEDIVQIIFLSVSGIFIIIIISLYFVNRNIAITLWEPFYKNIRRIEKFSVLNAKKINLDTTDIDEFNYLNRTIENFTEKITMDYTNIKQFMENASHELQTPITIIQTKFETFLNSNNLTEEQFKIFSSIQNAINRIKKMNKSLLLLAKIENFQFKNIKNINFRQVIDSVLEELKELIVLKNIRIEKQIDSDFMALFDETLAVILVTNLISNAIKYAEKILNNKSNIQISKIKVVVSQKSIIFFNSGNISLSKENLFKRFYKGNRQTSSPGLGLSIVDKICKINNLSISYSFNDKMHSFLISKK